MSKFCFCFLHTKNVYFRVIFLERYLEMILLFVAPQNSNRDWNLGSVLKQQQKVVAFNEFIVESKVLHCACDCDCVTACVCVCVFMFKFFRYHDAMWCDAMQCNKMYFENVQNVTLFCRCIFVSWFNFSCKLLAIVVASSLFWAD